MPEGLQYFNDVTEWTEEEKDSLYDAIERAKREWYTAQLQMQQADLPDLIDYSIYSFRAAEAKYTYLLKLAKAVHLHSTYDPYEAAKLPFWLKGRV